MNQAGHKTLFNISMISKCCLLLPFFVKFCFQLFWNVFVGKLDTIHIRNMFSEGNCNVRWAILPFFKIRRRAPRPFLDRGVRFGMSAWCGYNFFYFPFQLFEDLVQVDLQNFE